MIRDEAVEAATAALLKAWGYGTTSDAGTSADLRIALEAASPHLMAVALDSIAGYFDELASVTRYGRREDVTDTWLEAAKAARWQAATVRGDEK